MITGGRVVVVEPVEDVTVEATVVDVVVEAPDTAAELHAENPRPSATSGTRLSGFLMARLFLPPNQCSSNE
jgi:hypothetical protein